MKALMPAVKAGLKNQSASESLCGLPVCLRQLSLCPHLTTEYIPELSIVSRISHVRGAFTA